MGAKLQNKVVQVGARLANNSLGEGTKPGVKHSNTALIVSPWGAAFAVGIPCYANPPTPYYAGTKWKQVPSPSFQMNINPNTSRATTTPATEFDIVGGAPPAGGFSTPVTIGANSGVGS